MNVVWNSDPGQRIFTNLSVGEAFSHMGTLYMKIRPVVCEDRTVYNAVNLEKGEITRFRTDDVVTARNCTIVVEK